MVFNIAELVKLEYSHKAFKDYIGILSCLCFYLLAHYVSSLSYALLFSHADMVLNEEKRRMLTEVASKRKAGAGPSDADASTPIDGPPTTTSTPSPSAPAPVDLRQNGIVEATASEDEDTCSGLVFKRKKGADVAVPGHSASDDRAPSFRENLPSTYSPRDMVVHEGGGESATRGDSDAPPTGELPAFLQPALQSF